ncbi:MAG TPA: hypothetical protein VKV17_05530 [Bryobacteraceae bacterium]|nr:hypothetical protein [Bryobacteraceae bacterium]
MKQNFQKGLIVLMVTGWSAAYLSADTVELTGHGDFVGTFTISSAPNQNEPALTGYGGGFSAEIIGNSPSQSYLTTVFCVDFSNDVSLPSSHSVNLTPIAAGTQFTDDTRFGAVTAWRPVEDYLPGGLTLSAGVQNTIDNATALERYEMAAYLVSNYTFFGQAPPQSDNYYGDATNRGIQSAIWAILDPTSDLYLPPSSLSDSGDITLWLTNAANWLANDSSTAAGQQLLSRFRVVSDAQIAGSANPTQVGIQEFLTVQPVPEPGFYAVLAPGLAVVWWTARRKRRARLTA